MMPPPIVVLDQLVNRITWWNFVSIWPERMEQAKQDWKAGRCPKKWGSSFLEIPLTLKFI